MVFTIIPTGLQNQDLIQEKGFPGNSVVRNPPANAGDMASIPGSGRGDRWATGHGVAKELDTTQRPNNNNNKIQEQVTSSFRKSEQDEKRRLRLKSEEQKLGGVEETSDCGYSHEPECLSSNPRSVAYQQLHDLNKPFRPIQPSFLICKVRILQAVSPRSYASKKRMYIKV